MVCLGGPRCIVFSDKCMHFIYKYYDLDLGQFKDTQGQVSDFTFVKPICVPVFFVLYPECQWLRV